MKKLQLFTGIALFMLVSCQQEEIGLESTTNPSSRAADGSVLVKSIKRSTKFLSDVFTPGTPINFTYNGSKLVSISNYPLPGFGEGGMAKFTYNGNLIVKTEVFNDKIGLGLTKTYFYDKQGRIIRYAKNGVTVYRFKYNSNGTITGISSPRTSTIFTLLGNTNTTATKTENLPVNSQYAIRNIKYDGKNSPYKNITGFDKILFFDFDLDALVQRQGSQNPTEDNNPLGFGQSYKYTYNNAGFPISVAYSEAVNIGGVGTYYSDEILEYVY
jgi:YD repeat-containing protein